MDTDNELIQRVEASAYLSGLQNKYSDLTIGEAGKGISQLQQYCQHIQSLIEDCENHSFGDIEQLLIEFKARFSFTWSITEMRKEGEFAERGKLQTCFAELTIDLALRAAWQEVALKHKVLDKILKTNSGQMPGLFIFGMGKLGGNDLNFSSDVDLVAYFDPELLPVPEMLGKSYICHQALQKLTLLLGQGGRSDFIWRVDWRLRPNASATTLAMSTDAAMDYYYFRASPWHRLALMKARIVAGDKEVGQKFLNRITPFIWRQNLDYRALDELAEIKNRINLEHPALKVQRQWREPINEEVGGFNVKLGSGGIREIEFIANALQLVWGGKHYQLRTPNTLAAIAALEELEHLTPTLATQLVASYKVLRGIENAIQIAGNQQTHLIPRDSIAQEKLMSLLNESDWSSFVERLNAHRGVVDSYFEKLFADQATTDVDIEWPEDLSAAATDIVEAWESGFLQYGVSQSVRQRLRPLSAALADYLRDMGEVGELSKSKVDHSKTVMRLHDFFRSLPQGEQYFRLLAESPRLLKSMVPPLLYSPAMSTLLNQSPHIIDCYMGAALDPLAEFDSEFVLQAQNYEVRLERMRRFVNEHLYQLYLMFLQGELDVEPFQLSLSKLAEHTLELALKVVAENMGLDEVPITILGMGKVAMRRMSPLSDLDLIFIYDQNKSSLELATKFVSRLQTAISTPMREGIVYELDTRLRPSGKSGAPIVSLDSFSAHQMQRAHSWEHIALVPSCVVAGNKSLQAAIHDVKRAVLNTARDRQQFVNDAFIMWNRISEHRLKDFETSVMFSKLRAGGLMQSEYLTACLMLSSELNAASRAQSIKYDDLLAEHISRGQLPSELPEILQFWRVQQLWERLLGFTEQPLDSMPAKYLERLLAHSQVDSKQQLLEKKRLFSSSVVGWTNEFFADLEEIGFDKDDWKETNVQWLNPDSTLGIYSE